MEKRVKKNVLKWTTYAFGATQGLFIYMRIAGIVKWRWFQCASPTLIFTLLIIALIVAIVTCEYISTKCEHHEDESKWSDRADELAEWLF